MPAEVLRPLLDPANFEPFTIGMTSRTTYDINRPEWMTIESDNVATIRTPDGAVSHIALRHVCTISFADRPHVR